MRTLSFLLVPAIWLLCMVVCWLICRYRRIRATLVQCLIIGGLPLALGAIPLPLPFFLQIGMGYALTVYVTMKYLGVGLYPDGLLIPFVTNAVWQLVALALDSR